MNIDGRLLCVAKIASILLTTTLCLVLSLVVYPYSPWQNYSPSTKSSITIAQAGPSEFNIHYVPPNQIIIGAFLIGSILTLLLYSVMILLKKLKKKQLMTQRNIN